MSNKNCLRRIPLSDEKMKGRICTFKENPDANEFGDGSCLPCMSMDPFHDVVLHCENCIYCKLKAEIKL